MKLRTCNPSVRTSLLMLLSLLFVMSVTLPVFSVYSQPTGKTAEVVTQEPLVPQEDIPPAVGKELAAERGHMLRLRASEGNLNTVVFRNQDQTQTMYVFDHPVKYVNTVGEIKDISIEIANSTKEHGAFVTKDAYVQTFFPRDLYDGVTISADDVSIRSVPVAPASRNTAQAYRVDSETVAYPYGDKTSIEYTLTYTGYKEDIVVSSYTGQTEYQFRLYTGGLQLIREDGSYYLADSNGKIRATIGDIIVFTADERNNCMGSMTHVTVKPNEEYLLTIHLDADYLKDEKTAYPIRIDPTIEILYEQNGEGAIEDVTINSLEGSSGSSGSLFIGKRDTYGISRVLMKFPGLSEDLVASADQILKAEVELRDILGGSAAMTVTCYPFTGGAWDEDTASWTSVNPNMYNLSISSNTVSYSNGTSISHRYSFDITRAVAGWYSGIYDREQGILFKAPSSVENDSAALNKTFASYNRSSYQPSLSVVYTNPFYSSFENLKDHFTNTEIYVGQELWWYDDNLQFRSNCYGYSLQAHLSMNESLAFGTWYLQCVGEFVQKNSSFEVNASDTVSHVISSNESLREFWFYTMLPTLTQDDFQSNARLPFNNITQELLQADLESMGYGIEFTNTASINLPTNASKRLIIMVAGGVVEPFNSPDYHFYLQHTDGTWSHKRGAYPATDLCCCEENPVKLTNANIIDHVGDAGYNDYLLCFYVTKPAITDFRHTNGDADNCTKTLLDNMDLAGNHFNNAKVITVPSTIEGRIDYPADTDMYLFVASGAQIRVNFAFSSDLDTLELVFTLWNHEGNQVGTTVSATASTPATALFDVSPGSCYYVSVEPSANSANASNQCYTFSLNLT